MGSGHGICKITMKDHLFGNKKRVVEKHKRKGKERNFI